MRRDYIQTYKIERIFRDIDGRRDLIASGLTLAEARAYCRDPETTSSKCTNAEGLALLAECGPWFDSYETDK